MFFGWILPFANKAQDGKLITLKQCGELSREDQIVTQLKVFEEAYGQRRGDKNALFFALVITFKLELVWLVVTEVALCLIGRLSPLLLMSLITFVAEGSKNKSGEDQTNHLWDQGTFIIALIIS
jgi:hypothetical protein